MMYLFYSWKRFWRTIYAKPITEDVGQVQLEYARSEQSINTYHFRARSELVNRALKDFGTEHINLEIRKNQSKGTTVCCG
jgi:hypothetical protein